LKNSHKITMQYNKNDDPRENIFNFVVKNKMTLLEMSTKTDNLEDIFRKLTHSQSQSGIKL